MLLAGLAVVACSGGRTQIRVVGSSTVFPFTTAVAENFHRNSPEYMPPIVEATGTGGGIKLFCAGVGTQFPDVANASRRMKPGELADCARNGAGDVVEVQVGIDGLVLVQGKRGKPLNLRLVDVYRALAAKPFGKAQTARYWSDVNPALPRQRIEVLGPPPTSGTRDAFNELYMVAGCDTDPAMQALKKADEAQHKLICNQIREDGPFVEAGENDNLIVQKLGSNPNAVGVLGYSFLEQNLDTLRDVAIDGVPANYATISDFSYPASRPLFIYVKAQHARAIRGVQAFLDEYTAERAWGPGGYLERRGLVPSPEAIRVESRRRAQGLVAVTAAELEG